MKLSFAEWKSQVIKLAKKKKIVYLVPGNNILLTLHEQNYTPEQVIQKYFDIVSANEQNF
jgi:hypothetical protein